MNSLIPWIELLRVNDALYTTTRKSGLKICHTQNDSRETVHAKEKYIYLHKLQQKYKLRVPSFSGRIFLNPFSNLRQTPSLRLHSSSICPIPPLHFHLTHCISVSWVVLIIIGVCRKFTIFILLFYYGLFLIENGFKKLSP